MDFLKRMYRYGRNRGKSVSRWVSLRVRTPRYLLWRYQSLLMNRKSWSTELQMVSEIRQSGIYDLTERLTNPLEPYEGHNFLGYPAGGYRRMTNRLDGSMGITSGLVKTRYSLIKP